jgi:hypothetical protein
MPRLPPVTAATLPSSFIVVLLATRSGFGGY